MGVCVADYDNDGYPTSISPAYGPDVLFRNNGNGTFTDVTKRAAASAISRLEHRLRFRRLRPRWEPRLYVANYTTFDEKTIPRRGEDPNAAFMNVDVFCGPDGLQGQADVFFHSNGNGTFPT